MHQTIELIHALLENGKMSVKVFWDNTVFVNEVFANGRGLFSVLDGWMDGWMDDLYLNTIKIKATSLWGRV